MRPTGLTVICVVSLCLALFGGFSLLAGTAGFLLQPVILKFTEQMQQRAPAPPGVQQSDPLAMHRETLAVQRRWMGLLIGGMVLQAAAVFCLGVGALQGLRLRPNAAQWLIAGMVAGILHAGVSAYAGFSMQRETQAIVMRHMAQAQPGNMPPGAQAMTFRFMRLGEVVGLVFVAGWATLKSAYYAWGIWYLRRPQIRQLLQAQRPLEPVFEATSEGREGAGS